jgi:hypothetical protein
MIASLRSNFNQNVQSADYEKLQKHFEEMLQGPIPFRIAETPVFISKSLQAQILEVTYVIVDFLTRPDFNAKTERFIPASMQMPGETDHPQIVVVDYAIVETETGNHEPRLIEMQGFPSLHGFQFELDKYWKQTADWPETVDSYLNGYSPNNYLETLKSILIGKEQSEHVVLLDLFPDQQKTRLDFICTKNLLGIEPVCLTELKANSSTLYYERSGRKIPIRRIFNRLVPDELIQHPNLKYIDLKSEYDVTWINHPHHFYRISKCLLPILKHPFIPECHYLAEFNRSQALDEWVLKPLFSFAGHGVSMQVTSDQLDAIKDPEHWIMQRKVNYADAIATPDGPAKTEVRLFLLWKPEWERPVAMHNLARLSKGDMIGTQYNKDKSWVGGSIAFFER